MMTMVMTGAHNRLWAPGDDDDDDGGGGGVGVALSLKAHMKFSRKIRQKFPIFDQNVPLTLAFNDRL